MEVRAEIGGMPTLTCERFGGAFQHKPAQQLLCKRRQPVIHIEAALIEVPAIRSAPLSDTSINRVTFIMEHFARHTTLDPPRQFPNQR
jgi:hypothetical protein